MIRHALLVAAKDLRAEWRSKEATNASLAFAIVILLIFSFAFDPTEEQTRELSGGLLWLVFSFAGMLTLARSFARELTNDCLDALVASPISPAALYLGKAFSSFVLILIIEAVCLPMFAIFYNRSLMTNPWSLIGVALLATWGITVIGTMFSAMTVNLALRELMLPVLVYPLMIPVLVAAMQVTGAIIAGRALTPEDANWLRLLIGFDIIFTSLALALIEVVLVD